MVRSGTAFLAFVILVITPGPIGEAGAGEIEDEPFPLRILLALERASNFADTLGLQATAAAASGSSANPAADAAGERRGPAATVSTVNALSSSGAWMTANFGHVGFRPGERDRLSFAYAHTVTIDGDARRGFTNDFGSDEFYLRYGRAVSDGVTIGAELRYIRARLDEETIPADLGFPARFRTDITGPDLTVGARIAIDEDLSIGFQAGYGVSRTETKVENLVPVPIPGALVPVGTRIATVDSKVRFLDLRAGVGLAIHPDVRVLADLEFLHYEIDHLSKADTSRLFAGVKIRIADGLHAHLGFSADVEGELTESVGASYSPTESLAISLSYQHNAFPEVHAEFGQFRQFTLSVSFEF